MIVAIILAFFVLALTSTTILLGLGQTATLWAGTAILTGIALLSGVVINYRAPSHDGVRVGLLGLTAACWAASMAGLGLSFGIITLLT
jgi:archaellum biogenesis protein FlaJ (TadC family)